MLLDLVNYNSLFIYYWYSIATGSLNGNIALCLAGFNKMDLVLDFFYMFKADYGLYYVLPDRIVFDIIALVGLFNSIFLLT
jgi:hypothetical protein